MQHSILATVDGKPELSNLSCWKNNNLSLGQITSGMYNLNIIVFECIMLKAMSIPCSSYHRWPNPVHNFQESQIKDTQNPENRTWTGDDKLQPPQSSQRGILYRGRSMPTWPSLFDRQTLISHGHSHSHRIQAPLQPRSTLYNDIAWERNNFSNPKRKNLLNQNFAFHNRKENTPYGVTYVTCAST